MAGRGDSGQDGQAPAIALRGLTKIFSADPQDALAKLRAGTLDKQTLLERHGAVLALDDVDLDLAPGRISVVMGLSGSGKSTLLRHINRLIEPTAGAIEVGGRDIRTLDARALRALRRGAIAMVFQSFALMPHKTVAENVAYGLALRGVARSEQHARAARWIARVGLEGYEERYPHALSGGMQQRVGLARALASDAGVILMDEPFGALDPLTRAEMRTMLLELQGELAKTIIFITHDLEEALILGDDLAILRDGRIIERGRAQKVALAPQSPHAAAFMRGVDRGRLIRLETIARHSRTAISRVSARMTLRAATSLNDALAAMLKADVTVAKVVDGKGAAVGAVRLKDLATALAPLEEKPRREK